jgi:hypothetical protein
LHFREPVLAAAHFLSLEDLRNLRNGLVHLRVDVDGGAPRATLRIEAPV